MKSIRIALFAAASSISFDSAFGADKVPDDLQLSTLAGDLMWFLVPSAFVLALMVPFLFVLI